MDDLSKLPDVSEPAMLNNIRERYSEGKIYSYVSHILIR